MDVICVETCGLVFIECVLDMSSLYQHTFRIVSTFIAHMARIGTNLQQMSSLGKLIVKNCQICTLRVGAGCQ
jgi:hypothetical protein